MKTLEARLNISFVMIPIGFTLILTPLALNMNTAAKVLLILAGIIGVVGGLLYANHIYKLISDRENNENNTQNKLINAINQLTEELKKHS